MSRTNITEQEKNEIVNDYINGVDINSLIKKYHHKYKKIKEVLDEKNIHHGYTNNPKMKGHNKAVFSKEEKEKIIDAYVNQKKGLIACTKIVGHGSPNHIKKVLKEAGIKTRNVSEAAIESNEKRRKYTVNEEYFSIESHNMAYILGFLAADGTVGKDTNTIKIGLAGIDYDFLVSIQQEIKSDRGVKKYTNSKGFDCCQISFTSQKIKKDLAKYNIVPCKTFQFEFPIQLSREYWIDFIRGYFDGDGSVSTSGTSGIKWQICSATTDVLEKIVAFLYEEYQIPKVNVRAERLNKEHPLYVICYSTKATEAIYNFLYTKDSLYLPRKKQHYEQVLNIYNKRNKSPRDHRSLE